MNRSLFHGPAKHELMRHQFHQRSVDQNPSRDRIENAVDNESRPPLWWVCLPYAQANGYSDWRGDAVPKGEDVWGEALGPGPWDGGETGAQTQALKHLMENKDDVQGYELGAGHGERQPDEDRVEDDAELQDEHRGQLRHVVL